MLSNATTFRVGLFLLVGILLGLGVVIWLGVTRFLYVSNQYVTYFDESVSGLTADSDVKYRGVSVGRVQSINVAPDGRLVEVLMHVDSKVPITPDVRAQLKEAGITGIRFIELDRIEPSALEMERVLDLPFPTPAPPIPSQPSTLGQLFMYIDRAVERLDALDMEGVVDSIKATTNSIRILVSNPGWERIIGQLESITENLAVLTADLKSLAGDPHVRSALVTTDGLLRDLRGLSQEARESLASLDLDTRFHGTMDNLDRLVDSLDHRSALFQRRLDRITREMETTFRNLNDLSRTLKDQPSSLLFGGPKPERTWKE